MVSPLTGRCAEWAISASSDQWPVGALAGAKLERIVAR
jgi:hypothetical protein